MWLYTGSVYENYNRRDKGMVKLEQVSKVYDKFTLNCTMEVKPGHITGLVGANGAGKSTTFKAILGLIKTDGGTIRIFGKDIKDITAEDKEKMGVVMADAGLCEEFNIKTIMKVLKAAYKNFDEKYFEDMCKRFELPFDVKTKEFSTGMRARLNMIIALSHGARLLILDEPTSGLDVIARNELLDIIREYVQDDRSVLISSHISGDLEGICDDLYMIHDGEIVFRDDTDVLLDEYGMLKLTDEQYVDIDKINIRYILKGDNGYDCLTDNRQFYVDNYPDVVVEKGCIDSFLNIVEKGEKV